MSPESNTFMVGWIWLGHGGLQQSLHARIPLAAFGAPFLLGKEIAVDLRSRRIGVVELVTEEAKSSIVSKYVMHLVVPLPPHVRQVFDVVLIQISQILRERFGTVVVKDANGRMVWQDLR